MENTVKDLQEPHLYQLFKFFYDNHKLTLVNSEIEDIIDAVNKFQQPPSQVSKTAEEEIKSWYNKWLSGNIQPGGNIDIIDMLKDFASQFQQPSSSVGGEDYNPVTVNELSDVYWEHNSEDGVMSKEDFFKFCKIFSHTPAKVEGVVCVKEIPEVMKLDGIINTYVHAYGTDVMHEIQSLFWKAINAIQLQRTPSVLSSRTVEDAPPEGKGYSLEDMEKAFDAGYKHGWGQSEFEGESVTTTKKQFLASLPPQPVKDDWVSVEDGLPEVENVPFNDSAYVLCGVLGSDNSKTFVGWYNHKEKIWRVAHYFSTSESAEVTHWQPLPHPPKEDKTKEI